MRQKQNFISILRGSARESAAVLSPSDKPILSMTNLMYSCHKIELIPSNVLLLGIYNVDGDYIQSGERVSDACWTEGKKILLQKYSGQLADGIFGILNSLFRKIYNCFKSFRALSGNVSHSLHSLRAFFSFRKTKGKSSTVFSAS